MAQVLIHSDDGRVLPRATSRVVLRPIAAPLPMGFLALAVGSFVSAGLQWRWISPAQTHQVALCILAFVVPFQLLSAIFGVLARDVIAATGMAVLFGTWFALGLILYGSRPGSVSGALGLLLVASSCALVTVAAAAALTKPLATAVIAVSGLRFLTAGVFQLTGSDAWQTTTAVVGLLLTGLAWYAAAAFLLENLRHRPLLPTFRTDARGDGSPGDSIPDAGEVETEPGVRSPA